MRTDVMVHNAYLTDYYNLPKYAKYMNHPRVPEDFAFPGSFYAPCGCSENNLPAKR